ncbi:MAG: FecR domain-containing protein, partial [Planctomycetota bacterium]
MSRPVRDVEAQAARLATQLCDGRATVVAAVEARLLADPVLARAVLEQLVLHAALAADGVDLPGRLASELQAVNGEGRVQRITALVRGSPMARHRRRQSVFRRMGLAAALLLSVLGGLVWFRSPPVAEAGPLLRVLAGSVQVQATSRDRSRAVADELHLQPGAMVATGPGGSCIVQLDDGSRLELGPDSRLHWPMGPTDPPRVERGRVVCRIAPQGLGRFRLQVGALTVEVLGTVFTAIGRPAHDRVLVAEGRVVVYAEGRRLAVLAAEEGLRRNRDGRCLTWRQPEHPDAPVVADGPWLDADGGLLWGVDIPLGVR